MRRALSPAQPPLNLCPSPPPKKTLSQSGGAGKAADLASAGRRTSVQQLLPGLTTSSGQLSTDLSDDKEVEKAYLEV